MRLLNVKKVQAKVKARTAQIIVGNTYFLSSFYDKEGAMVKVLKKSTAINGAGWASTVTVEVLAYVGDGPSSSYYTPGKITTVNASNLYERRELANPQYKSMKTASDFVRRATVNS
jgi:hypothetical protein